MIPCRLECEKGESGIFWVIYQYHLFLWLRTVIDTVSCWMRERRKQDPVINLLISFIFITGSGNWYRVEFNAGNEKDGSFDSSSNNLSWKLLFLDMHEYSIKYKVKSVKTKYKKALEILAFCFETDWNAKYCWTCKFHIGTTKKQSSKLYTMKKLAYK